MKESQFLGTLLPSHPDFLPIEKAIREKYGLPELSPDDGPIPKYFKGRKAYLSKNSEKILKTKFAWPASSPPS